MTQKNKRYLFCRDKSRLVQNSERILMEIVQNSERILMEIVQNFEEILNKKDICKEENEIEN